MNTDCWMRASDQDRNKVAELLCDAYAIGRLSRDEFDERSVAAFSARTYGELRDVTADLSDPPTGGFPSDMVTERDVARAVARRRGARTAWACLFVLVAGLAARVFPAAVWMLAIAVLLVLVLPARSR